MKFLNKDFILLSQVQLWKPWGRSLRYLRYYKVELVPARNSESESGSLLEMKRSSNIIFSSMNIPSLSMYYCISFPTITSRAMKSNI